jgi:POT family proton-dependent oligopeptide transporter
MVAAAPATDRQFFGHPAGLFVLFMTEMWERFSYYGTRAFLVLYMVAEVAKGGLGFTTADAASIYGLYTGTAYLVALAGGVIADNLLGARRCVLYGGIGIAAGNAMLAAGTLPLFYGGLALIILGTGLLKPNATTMVGMLYSDKDPRRDSGYSIYYMGINIGAFASPIVCGYLAQVLGWRLGFLAAFAGMSLGIAQYLLFQSRLGDVGQLRRASQSETKQPTAPFSRAEWLRIAAIGVFFVFSMIFWAAFEQAGSSMNLFAEQLTANTVFGWAYPSSWLQSVNSIFIILLAPVFSALWLKLGDRQPSSPLKFAIGLLGAGAGFVVLAYAGTLTGAGKVSPLWLIGVYLLHTIGELCLSPVGLSITSKLAPPRIVGMMMGVWFMSISAGNYLAGFVARSFEANQEVLVRLFGGIAAVCLVAAVVLVALTPFTKKLMGDVK